MGVWEYFIYSKHITYTKENFRWLFKIILPFLKVGIAFILLSYSLPLVPIQGIVVKSVGLYLMGLSFHKGIYFQLRRIRLSEEDFHFFSHSNYSLIPIKNITIIDIYAFSRIILFLVGYTILYIYSS